MSDLLQKINIMRLRLPLKVPYKLAFGNVEAFDTLLAEGCFGERTGVGEATALSGYTSETIEYAWEKACQIAPALIGQSREALKAELNRHTAKAPFTVCMFMTAIEMAERHHVLSNHEEARVPLLFGLNHVEALEIEKAFDQAYADGYRTAKVKVGFDADKDLERVGLIQAINSGRLKLRIDGNQGFSAADAVKFATKVVPDDIELLEQPCHMDDWSGLAEVARGAAVPLMLDESIYNDDDIGRAAEIGASHVKLKLMKLMGIDALRASIQHIRDLGMEPVLGNGVASDIGCWMELCVARDLISNAGEMNGFLRPTSALVMNPLEVKDGCAVLPANYCPQLDCNTMAKFAVANRQFS